MNSTSTCLRPFKKWMAISNQMIVPYSGYLILKISLWEKTLISRSRLLTKWRMKTMAGECTSWFLPKYSQPSTSYLNYAWTSSGLRVAAGKSILSSTSCISLFPSFWMTFFWANQCTSITSTGAAGMTILMLSETTQKWSRRFTSRSVTNIRMVFPIMKAARTTPSFTHVILDQVSPTTNGASGRTPFISPLLSSFGASSVPDGLFSSTKWSSESANHITVNKSSRMVKFSIRITILKILILMIDTSEKLAKWISRVRTSQWKSKRRDHRLMR